MRIREQYKLKSAMKTGLYPSYLSIIRINFTIFFWQHCNITIPCYHCNELCSRQITRIASGNFESAVEMQSSGPAARPGPESWLFAELELKVPGSCRSWGKRSQCIMYWLLGSRGNCKILAELEAGLARFHSVTVWFRAWVLEIFF